MSSTETSTPVMRHKRLGQTGKEVGIVGLGTAFVGRRPEDAGKIAGDFEVDRELASSTIVAGLHAGIDLIDTAPYYGTESAVGDALRAAGLPRENVAVMTKAGRTGLETFDYTRDGVFRQVDKSLKLLGLDYVDVVSIHDANEAPFEEVMGPNGAHAALVSLMDEGVVRSIGTACWDHEVNARYLATGGFHVAICSTAYSLLNHLLRERILPEAEKVGASLIAAEPLERGLLALGVQPGREYAQRRFSPAVLESVRSIQALAEANGFTLLQVALQWLSRERLVTSAIPGPANEFEARSNAAAASVPIPESFWQELEPMLVNWSLADIGVPI